VAFKRLTPRKGTVIPESHRPQGSTNAVLHELPAFREHTHDLIGVVLYLPRQMLVVVPFRLCDNGGAGCVIVEGDKKYPRGGYDIYVSEWELQRAERVVLRVPRRPFLDDQVWLKKSLRRLADGGDIWVQAEDAIVVEPDPDVRCRHCGKWLSNPDAPVSHLILDEGQAECRNQDQCLARKQNVVYRAPVQS